jgi:hypothetical protein
MAHHPHGQQRADGERIETLIVSELENGRTALPGDPHLRRHRLIVNPDNP